MAKRSLVATDAGIRKAKQAFQRTGWTQSEFAMEVGLSTRQPIWKFFKSRPIDRAVFVDICFSLNLDWEETAGVGPFSLNNSATVHALTESSLELPPLVSMVQAHLWERQQQQYRWMPVSLDLAQPLSLTDTYVSQTVWTVPRRLWSLATTASTSEGIAVERSWGDCLPLVEMLQQHSQLILQGQLGSGKTTALRFLGKACLEPGNVIGYAIQKVPLFLQLDESMDFSAQLTQQWQAAELSSELLTTLSDQGYILLLLDGFHQLSEHARCRIRSQIEQWSQQHPKNSIILTCRPSCDEAHFYNFAVVELAPLNPEQVQTFVKRWFLTVKPEESDRQAQRFLAEWVHSPWSQELGPYHNITPLLLHSLCLWFQKQKGLLTHLPNFYQTWLDLVLFRWGRVAGHPTQSPALNQGILESLTHIAVQTTSQPHGHHGVIQMAQTWQAFGVEQSSFSVAWSSSQAALGILCYDYALLQEVKPSDYQFVDTQLQIYLCSLYYANSITCANALPHLLQSLEMISFDNGIFLFRTLLSLTPDPYQLLRLLFGYWQTLIVQVPTLQALLVWVRRKAEQSPAIEPSFAQAFYYLLARQGAVQSFNLFGLALLTQLSESMWRDIHLEYSRKDVQEFNFNTSEGLGLDDGFVGRLDNPAELEHIFQSMSMGTTYQSDAAMMPDQQLMLSPEGMTGSQDGTWQKCFTSLCQSQYDLGYQWSWPSTLSTILARYDRALAIVLVTLQEEGLNDFFSSFVTYPQR